MDRFGEKWAQMLRETQISKRMSKRASEFQTRMVEKNKHEEEEEEASNEALKCKSNQNHSVPWIRESRHKVSEYGKIE